MATIDDLTTQTTALLTAVNVQKATLDAAVSNAAAQAAAALANSNTAGTANANAQTALAGTTSAAAQAANARDQANAAWAASMAPAETLPAISKSIHSGAIVKEIIYATDKDSDGGAWRKRCADKSWYNETICAGQWRSQLTNLAAAWAVTGAAAGDFYQHTTDGKFYMIGGTIGAQTQTEVFRGNVREFPEQVAIIAESARVVIYDLTQVGTPMWMVFKPTNGTTIHWYITGSTTTSVAALNGRVFWGGYLTATPANQNGGVLFADFAADSLGRYGATAGATAGAYKGGISNRNNGINLDGTSLPVIIGNQVNDVAAIVLDNASVDPATGLRVPTIAVATAGGVSVINNDGTVANLTYTINANNEASFVRFLLYGGIGWGSRNAGSVYYQIKNKLPTASDNTAPDRYYNNPVAGSSSGYLFYKDSATNDGMRAAAPTSNTLAIATSAAISIYKENPASPAKGMVAYITNAYNSGWQVGDSRGAWLSDTVAETITASGELVVNGTFDTDLAGWDLSSANTSATWVAGAARITDTGATTPGPRIFRAITGLVVGKSYSLEVAFSGTVPAGGLTIAASNNTSITGSLSSANSTANPQTVRLNFVAAATSHNMLAVINPSSVGQYADIDNVSVKLVNADRSVKNNGLTLNGALTKSPVATGAQLVEYFGFGMDGSGNATNYIGGAGSALGAVLNSDFHVPLWWDKKAVDQDFYLSTSGPKGYPYTSMADGMVISVNGGTGAKAISLKGWSAGVRADSASLALDGSIGLVKLDIVRRNNVLEVYRNGVLLGTGAIGPVLQANPSGSGLWFLGSHSSDGYLLLRVSATPPSADQIAHMYRTELALMQPGSQGTLDGTSSAITALAYDDTTDVLQVGTSWGRSAFRDLVRIESAVSTVGAITSLSANQGAHISGGASAGRYYQPAMLLRDELRRKEEARKALGKVPVFFDFDAVTSQTAFVLPKGYTARAVYSAEALKREGATKTYTRSYDGFAETINFAVAPGNAVWVSIMCVRSN